MQWFRLYNEFATDAKVQSMTEAMQRRLIMIFCLRSSDVLVTLQEQELAFQLRINDEELAKTKQLFMQKKFIDERWNLLNWDKRQFASDSSTERTRAWREKSKKNVVTSQKRHGDLLDTDTDTDTDTEKNSLRVAPKGARRRRKPDPAKRTDPSESGQSTGELSPVKAVLSHFEAGHLATFGEPVHVNWGKDGKLAKSLIRTFTESAKVCELIDRFFTSRDEFIRRSGYSFGAFFGCVNKLTKPETRFPSQGKYEAGFLSEEECEKL